MDVINGSLPKYNRYREISNELYRSFIRLNKDVEHAKLLSKHLDVVTTPMFAQQEKVNRTIILAAITVLKNRGK